MAALNLPLITWCVIVAAMTVLITVRLFHKGHNPAVRQHMQPHRHLMEIGNEREEFFVPGDKVSNRDEAVNDVDY